MRRCKPICHPGSQVALVWYKFPVNDWWPSAAHQLAGRGGTEAGMRSNGIPDRIASMALLGKLRHLVLHCTPACHCHCPILPALGNALDQSW